jgi:membrane-associated phospholipid phosphatase
MEKWITPGANIGMYGPIFLTIIAIWQLYYLPKYLIWFLAFLWMNESIILFAKRIIREPRPGQKVLPENQITEPAYYGMPSGHAQHAGFIMTFLWLVNPSWAVLCICAVIATITLMERYTNKRHSIEQLVIGGFSGMAFAYVSVMMLQKYYEY